jgi:ABC-type antimicrobial peptide transport system permease subunit
MGSGGSGSGSSTGSATAILQTTSTKLVVTVDLSASNQSEAPTGNLDSTSGGEVINHLHRLACDGATLVLITHDRRIAGLIIGAGATAIYAQAKHEPFIVPLYALITAPAAGLLVGAIAGLYPAIKAARLSPTEALRTT